MSLTPFPRALLLASALALAALAAVDEKAPLAESDFLRFVEDAVGARLQTSVTRFRREADGVRVDLVGAVHVGETSYYAELQRRFEGYDALLYELVAEAGTVPKSSQRETSGISAFQRFLKDRLRLEFQLDSIDYSKPNFVHADMDPATFARLHRERGESLLGLMLRAVKADLARQRQGKGSAQISAIELAAAFLGRDSPRRLKLLLGRHFEDMEAQIADLAGDKGTVIIHERNRVALEVLDKAVGEGKKRLGIFYGAGHLPDMEKRLLGRGFRKVEEEWLTAWDIPAESAEAEKSQPRRMRF